MPLYEFECEACKKRFERIQKFSDANPEVCPTCGKGPVRRMLSSPAIQFKGSGFYITDYAKKSSSEAGSKSGSAASESSATTTSADSKSESKPAESKSTDTAAKSTDKS
ncbi:MAG TPA: zinc ribbon domain-containing protein [Usitatibacter sp.]|nr:zinc ribbon domain-containing protein [Usitatibacter sp.]